MESKCIIRSFMNGELPQATQHGSRPETCPGAHCEVVAYVGRASSRDQIGFREADNDIPLTSCEDGLLFSQARQQAEQKR